MKPSRYTQYMYSYPHKTAYGPLRDTYISDYLHHLSGSGGGLYLHLPFCEGRCGYCNLFSVTGQGAADMDRYLDTVERQLSQYQPLLEADGCRFTDFTIGGGTPLLLSESQLRRVFAMVRRYTALEADAPVTIETAPNQTTPEKLALLKEAGATRISMGIQSFSDEELNTLRRNHQAEKARTALSLLMDQGFPCVNVDFIYGVPGQSEESFLASVKEALSYEPEELFLYPLYLKHGAILEQQLNQGMVLDEELAYRQYALARDWLRSHGYRQDSMRRFVRIQSQGAHREFSDCGFGNTLSLGCGGRSYLGNLHFCTPYAVTRKDCLAEIRRYEKTEDFCRIPYGFLLSEEEQRRRYAIRHLLIRPGLDHFRYSEAFHSDVRRDFPILDDWCASGYLTDDGRWLTLTDSGLGLSDHLGPQLISDEVLARMMRWEERYGTGNGSIQRQLKKL